MDWAKANAPGPTSMVMLHASCQRISKGMCGIASSCWSGWAGGRGRKGVGVGGRVGVVCRRNVGSNYGGRRVQQMESAGTKSI